MKHATKMALTLLSLVLFGTMSVLPAMAGVYPGRLGVGVSLPERGGTYVDAAKLVRWWQEPGMGAGFTASDVDANAWPLRDCATVLMDWRPVAEWVNQIDDPEVYRVNVSGTYKMSFNGQATLSVLEGDCVFANQIYHSSTNTTTADFIVPVGSKGVAVVNFTNTKRTGTSATNTGFTNLKLIVPGYTGETQLFYQPFLNALNSASFCAIRFMDFRHTNNSEPVYPAVTEWSQRRTVNEPIFDGDVRKLEGAPWEHVIELANTVRKDIWINVPLSATTDYVTQLANLIKNTLDPSLNIYVESSNEVWNSIFNQYNYNIAQANALGITEHQNHARRTVELANIFAGVFGSSAINNRVKVMLCSHAPMWEWWVKPMLEYVNTTFGPPRNYIYAIASQTYFGGAAATGSSQQYARATVTQILEACHTDIANQLSSRQSWLALANTWSLPGGYCSYEGGPDFGGGSTTNIANRITANRVEGMKTEFKYNLDENFFAIGGNIAMQFVLSSGYNRYGCWGLTDDITNPDRNFKFQAAREILGDGLPTPVPTPTSSIAPSPTVAPTPTASSGTLPGSFSLLSPSNNAKNVSKTPSFDWADSAGATSYTIVVDNNSDFSSPEINQSGLIVSNYNATVTLGSLTKYYWKVVAVNGTGSTQCNSTFAFTTRK